GSVRGGCEEMPRQSAPARVSPARTPDAGLEGRRSRRAWRSQIGTEEPWWRRRSATESQRTEEPGERRTRSALPHDTAAQLPAENAFAGSWELGAGSCLEREPRRK